MGISYLQSQQFLQPILETIKLVFGLPSCVWLLENNRKRLQVAACTEPLRKCAGVSQDLSPSSAEMKVVQTKASLVIEDIASEKPWEHATKMCDMRLNSVIITPLRIKKNVVGGLNVYAPQTTNIPIEQQQQEIEAFALQIGASLRQIQGLQTLSEVGSLISIMTGRDDDLFERIMRAAQRVLDCRRVSIFLQQPNGELTLKAASSTRIKRRRFKRGEGLAASVIQTGKALLVSDVRKHPEFLSGLSSQAKERSMLLAPILFRSHYIGVISADMDGLNGFDEQDKTLIEGLASQAAIVVHNAKLFEEKHWQQWQFEVLAEVEKELTSIQSSSESEVLDLIYRQAGKLINNDNFAIILNDIHQAKLHVALAYENGERIDNTRSSEQTRLFNQIGQEKIETIIQSQEPILLPTRAEVRSRVVDRKEKIHCTWMGVPMRLGTTRRTIGAFVTYHPTQEYAYNRDDVKILDMMSDQAANALDNARTRRELEVLAEVEQTLTAIQTSNEEEILHLIYQQAQRLTDTRNFAIVLYDNLTNELRFALAYEQGKPINVQQASEQLRLFDQFGSEKIERIIHTQDAILLQTYKEVKEQALDSKEKIHASWMGVPMRLGHTRRAIGAFLTYHPTQERAYDADDVKIWDMLSDQAANALDNARSRHQLEVLAKVEQELTAIRSSNEQRVLTLIYKQAKQLTDTRNFVIILYERGTGRLRCPLAYKGGEKLKIRKASEQAELLTRIGRKKIETIIQTQQPILLQTRDDIERQIADPQEEIHGTWVGVPMRLGQKKRAIGAFVLYNPTQEDAYDADDVKVLDMLSDQAANAIDNARLKRQFEVLADAERELTVIQTNNEQKALSLIYKQAKKLTDTQNFFIVQQDKSTGQLKLALAYENGNRININKASEQHRLFQQIGLNAIEQIIQSQKPLLLETQERVKSETGGMSATWLGVPMRLRNTAIGAFIMFHSTQEYAYDKDDVQILDAFSDQAANALDNVRLNQRFKVLSEVERRLVSEIRLSVNDVLQLIGEQTQKLHEVDTRNLAIILHDKITGQPECFLALQNGCFVENLRDDTVQQPLLRSLGMAKVAKIIQTQKPILLKDREAIAAYPGTTDDEVYASWVGVPMRLRDTAIGAFVTYHESKEHVYDETDMQILDTISDQAAIALDNVRLTNQLEELSEAERELTTVLSEIEGGVHESDVLQHIYHQTQRFKEIHTRNLAILLNDRLTKQLRVALAIVAGKPIDVEKENFQESFLEFLGRERIEKIIHSQQPIILRNRAEVASQALFPDKERYASWVGVPMRLNDEAETIGAFVTFHWTRENVYDEDDVKILDALSDQAANIIDTTQVTQRLAVQNRRREVLVQLGHELASSIQLTETEILQRIYESVTQLLEINSMFIAMFDDSSNRIRFDLVYRDGVQINAAKSEKWKIRGVREGGRTGWVIQNKQPLLHRTRSEAEAWYNQPGHEKRPEPTTNAAWMRVPMIWGNKVLGVIGVGHKQEYKYDDGDVEILSSIANQAAIALENARLFRQTDMLRNVAQIVSTTLDSKQLSELVLSQLQRVIEYDSASIQLIKEDERALLGYRGFKPTKTPPDELLRNVSKDPLVNQIVKKKEPMILSNVEHCSEWKRMPETAHVNSWMGIPIIFQDKVIGLLTIDHTNPGHYTQESGDLAVAFSQQVAPALAHAEIFEDVQSQLEQRLNDLSILRDVYESVGKDPLPEVLKLILEKSVGITDSDYADLWLFDSRTNEVWINVDFHERRTEKMYQHGQLRFNIHENTSIVGHVVKTRESYLSNDISSDPYYWDVLGDVKSELAVPMQHHDEIIGVLNFESSHAHAFSTEQLKLLEALARQAAIAIHNARLYNRLQMMNTRQKALVGIGQTLTAEIRLREAEVLDLIYTQAYDKLEMRNFSIGLYDEQQQLVRFAVTCRHGYKAGFSEAFGWRVSESEEGKVDRVIHTKEVVLLNSLKAVQQAGSSRGHGSRDYEGGLSNAWLGVPMMSGGKVLGIITTYHYGRDNFFTDDDVEILEALANQAAIAIDNARLYYELDRQVHEQTKALEESRQRLEDIIEFLPDATFVIDQQGKVLLWNHAIEDLTGIKSEDIVGKGNYDYALPFYETRRPILIDLALRPDEKFEKTYHSIRKEGSTLVSENYLPSFNDKPTWVYAKASPLYDPQGEIVGAISTIRDITPQKQAEEIQRSLYQISEAAHIAGNLGILFSEIHDIVKRLMPARNLYIALYDAAANILRFPYYQDDYDETPVDRTLGKGLTDYIIRTGSPLLCPPTEFERLKQEGKVELSGEPSCDWLGVPLKIHGDTIGVLAVQSYTKNITYGEREQGILLFVSNQIAAAIERVRASERLEKLNHQQNVLIGLGHTLASSIQVEEHKIMQLICESASKLINIPDMYVALYDELTDTIFPAVGIRNGKPIDVSTARGQEWQPRRAGRGLTEKVIRTGKPIFMQTGKAIAEWYAQSGHQLYHAKPACTALVVPMTIGKTVLGVIGVSHATQEYFYTDDDQEILQALADYAAIAINNARLFKRTEEQLRQRIGDLRALQDIYGAIGNAPVQEVLKLIVKKAADLTNSDYGDIWLFDRSHRELTFEVECGSSRFNGSIPEPVKLDQRSVIALVAKQGQSYICNNPDTDPYYWRTLQDAQAELAVPLRFKDQIIGVLDVESKKLNAYTEDHQKLLETLADQAAIAWENTRLYNEMEQRVQERTKTLEEATKRIAETQHILTRTTLAADFVHQMNNQAGTIPVWADLVKSELLAQKPQIPKAIEYLTYITTDINELLRAAEQLKTPYRKTQIDIAATLLAILRQLRIQYGKDIKLGNLDIQQEIHQNLHRVWGMPSTLPNALFNVIANGIEAIVPENPGVLTITVDNAKDERNLDGVVIEIHDTGKGVAEEDRDKMFVPFFSTKGEGRGYGLWRAKNVIEGLGGTIQADFKEPGTTFMIFLPKASEEG